MSHLLRLLPKCSHPIARVSRTARVTRSLHSPFKVLGNSPLTSPAPPSMTYEKQMEHSSEPISSSSGTRTYVVSEPDASSKFYEVPSGAYPTSTPYVNFTPTDASRVDEIQVRSTSSTPLAHKQIIRTVSYHYGGVGESAAVGYGQAPGERGGSYGGLG